MKNSNRLAAVIITALIFIAANVAMAQKAGGAWNIPANYKTKKSTVKAGDPSINTVGKDLFAKHCKSCHGSKGLGDGPKAASLKTNPGDFSSAAFQASTDGELFFRTNVGRDEMPAYEKKIPEANDRWALVAFMRTLKK